MIWSLTKIFLFICLIALVTFAASMLIDTGGEVLVKFGGMEISLTPVVAIICLALFIAALWLAYFLLGILMAVFRFFNGDETAISRYFNRNRERRGFDALAEGMVAIAAGEGKLAVSKAARAEKYLNRPELTHLVSAQAAEISGDRNRALKYYKNLLENDRTRFVGVQGILKQKLDEGDTDTALRLAEKAFALQPKHENTLNTLFELQSEKGDWSGARKTVEAKVRASTLPRDIGRRREAVLVLADARNSIDDGDMPAGKTAAIHANSLSPDLVPAAVLAAEMHMLDNSKRAATKLLKKAWRSNPHPDLAAAFAGIVPEETPLLRNKRFQSLLKVNPDHAETKMLRAELLLAAEEFPAARRALDGLAQSQPTARSLSIMAAIAKGEGAEDHVVRGWLAKALGASRGPQWICDKCSKIHSNWAPKCDNCQGFDTMAWKSPPQSDDVGNTPSMLPMMPDLLATESAMPEAVETADEAEIIAESK